jgi:hypothetical protein
MACECRFTSHETAYAGTPLEKQLEEQLLTMLNKLDELATLRTKLLLMLGQIKHRKTSIKPTKGPPEWRKPPSTNVRAP